MKAKIKNLDEAIFIVNSNANIEADSFTYCFFENNKFSKTKIKQLINSIKFIGNYFNERKKVDKDIIHKIFFIYSRTRINLTDFLLENYYEDIINRKHLKLYDYIEDLENSIFHLLSTPLDKKISKCSRKICKNYNY